MIFLIPYKIPDIPWRAPRLLYLDYDRLLLTFL